VYACAFFCLQGEVEEDFEAMAAAVHQLAPHLEIDLEMEVAPSKRLRPVEAVRSHGSTTGDRNKTPLPRSTRSALQLLRKRYMYIRFSHVHERVLFPRSDGGLTRG